MGPGWTELRQTFALFGPPISIAQVSTLLSPSRNVTVPDDLTAGSGLAHLTEKGSFGDHGVVGDADDGVAAHQTHTHTPSSLAETVGCFARSTLAGEGSDWLHIIDQASSETDSDEHGKPVGPKRSHSHHHTHPSTSSWRPHFALLSLLTNPFFFWRERGSALDRETGWAHAKRSLPDQWLADRSLHLCPDRSLPSPPAPDRAAPRRYPSRDNPASQFMERPRKVSLLSWAWSTSTAEEMIGTHSAICGCVTECAMTLSAHKASVTEKAVQIIDRA